MKAFWEYEDPEEAQEAHDAFVAGWNARRRRPRPPRIMPVVDGVESFILVSHSEFEAFSREAFNLHVRRRMGYIRSPMDIHGAIRGFVKKQGEMLFYRIFDSRKGSVAVAGAMC